MKILNGAFLILRNKFLIASICFLVWMIFFDPKDISLIFSRQDKLKALEKSEQSLTRQIAQSRTELNLLKTKAQRIEKYARE